MISKTMNNIKCRFFSLILCLSIFSIAGYPQTINKQTAIKNCLIVSDIHFSPLFGTPKDTTLKRKLETSSFEEWKKIFESSDRQMTVNSNLLFQDANYGVLKSALANMKKRLPHPAFIIIAGDFIWHGAKPADSVLKRKSIQFIAGLFKDNFPGVPILPAMGNNDTYGADYDLQDTKFLNDFADAWSPNLPKAAADQLKTQGYYTWETGYLKLMVINSAPLSYGSHYPQGAAMFNWLETNLANTKNAWIIMHIPPGINAYNGKNFWNADYAQTFINDVVKYAAQTRFIIASHTHFNDFRVFYNAADQPVSFMRIVPSIGSNHGNNPSFEVAQYNNATGRVITETNYYLNLAAIPTGKTGEDLSWDDTLSLPSSFKLEKIDAQSFSKFIDKVKTDESWQLLTAYTKFYTVGTKIDSSIRVSRGNYMKYLKADSLKAK
jgi:sphingomyelin phosphodiesterase acid-like 3